MNPICLLQSDRLIRRLYPSVNKILNPTQLGIDHSDYAWVQSLDFRKRIRGILCKMNQIWNILHEGRSPRIVDKMQRVLNELLVQIRQLENFVFDKVDICEEKWLRNVSDSMKNNNNLSKPVQHTVHLLLNNTNQCCNELNEKIILHLQNFINSLVACGEWCFSLFTPESEPESELEPESEPESELEPEPVHKLIG